MILLTGAGYHAALLHPTVERSSGWLPLTYVARLLRGMSLWRPPATSPSACLCSLFCLALICSACVPGAPATSAASASPSPGPTLAVPMPEMVLIEPAVFEMGSDDGRPEEAPVHSVQLTHGYHVARYAVTFEQYDLFCDDTGHHRADSAGRSRGAQPVINVTWYDAVAYCNWLSERHGLVPCYSGAGKVTEWDLSCSGYRLPTEAEWENAARGGSHSLGYLYAGSDDPSAVAWYDANSGDQLHPVGQKLPNELGLYDMSGNLYEWCWDWYSSDYYSVSPLEDPTGPASPTITTVRGGERVRRSGSWRESAFSIRVTARSFDYANYAGDNGFRLVRSEPTLTQTLAQGDHR